ncbi:hypothetical protein BDK51DRAFT_27304, partial [Blyttiomyces helicus]
MTSPVSVVSPLSISAGPPSVSVLAIPRDAWRRTLVLSAKRLNERILDTASVTVPDTTKWTTCADAVDGTSLVMVGSAASSNNLFVAENMAPNKFAVEDSSSPPPSLALRSAFTAPHPIHHLSISGDRLATAGPNGRVQLFKLDLAELNQKGCGLAHLGDYAIGSTKLEDLRLSPPGTMIRSVCMNYIEFAPTSPFRAEGVAPKAASKLLAIDGRSVCLFDLETAKVYSKATVGHDMLRAASWSPHPPDNALICAGGVDSHLRIIDSRIFGNDSGNGVVWRVDHAHNGSITTAKFNPFVPYWIASTGEDAVVKVWDIRFQSHPVARVDGHSFSIQSFAWSNTHCEMFSTGTSDRVWRAWSLSADVTTARVPRSDIFFGCPGSEWSDDVTEEPVVGAKLIGECMTGYSASIVSVIASPSHADTYYTLSAVGEIMSHTIRDELLEKIAPHSYPEIGASCEHEVERAIFCRDLAAAYRGCLAASRAARAEGRLTAPAEKELIDLCISRPPVDPDAWTPAEAPADIDGSDRFRRDLAGLVEHLPPRFAEFSTWYNMVKPKDRLEFELLVLRYSLLQDALKGISDTVIKAEKMMCKGMQIDSTFLDGNALKLVIETLIPTDYPKALSLGVKLGDIVEDTPSRSPKELIPLVTTLLFPTVFEADRWLQLDPPAAGTDPKATLSWRGLPARLARLRERVAQGYDSGLPGEAEQTVEPSGKEPEKSSTRAVASKGAPAKDLDALRAEALLQRAIAPGALLGMVRLEIRLSKLIANPSDKTDEDIVQAMQLPVEPDSTPSPDSGTPRRPALIPFEPTISSFALRLYLDALLGTKRFETYFASCFNIIS